MAPYRRSLTISRSTDCGYGQSAFLSYVEQRYSGATVNPRHVSADADPTTAKAASTAAKRKTPDQFRSARTAGMRSPPRTLLTSLPLLSGQLVTTARIATWARLLRRCRTRGHGGAYAPCRGKSRAAATAGSHPAGGPSSEPVRALAATKNLAQRVRAAPLPVPCMVPIRPVGTVHPGQCRLCPKGSVACLPEGSGVSGRVWPWIRGWRIPFGKSTAQGSESVFVGSRRSRRLRPL